MHDSASILSLILRSIFIGFGFVVPIVTLLRTSDLKKLKFKELFILTAVQAVRVAGILNFVLFAIEVIADYYNKYLVLNYGGSFLLYYLYPPLMCLLLTQLFWIKKLYIKKPALISFSLLLLLLPSKTFLFFIRKLTTYNISITESWYQSSNHSLTEFILNIIVFIFIIITIMLAGNKFKHIKQ